MSDSNFEKIKKLSDMQHSEADLHWKRNGFFLLSSSILLLALSQFQLPLLMIAFAILGLMLNAIWILIQYRSSEYIKHWKKRVKKLEESLHNPPDIYSPKVGGYEMRKLAFLLPFPFIMIWASVLGQALYDLYIKTLTPT